MRLEDFRQVVEHVRTANYPKRALYVAAVQPRLITNSIHGLDVHQVELIKNPSDQESPELYLERRLSEICKEFAETRKEPSALIILDAVLLARYSVSLAPLLSKAISPRSMAILCLPGAAQTSSLMGLSEVVDHDFSQPLQRLEKQIGGQDCTIEE